MGASPSTNHGPGGARHEAGPWTRRGTRGPRLYFTLTLPPSPRAVVGLLHGFADYGARYAHVADAWAEHGLATVTLDLRGHGRAEGARGFCLRFQEYVDDVAELPELVREQVGGLPAFLYGHSFGGLAAIFHMLDTPGPWKGVLLTAPNLGIGVPVPALKRLAGRITSVLLPGFGLPSGLHGADMTHDAAAARAYDADPLVFKNARARWFTETLAAHARALARAPSFRAPLYVAMGTEDHVGDFAAARAFYDAAGSTDKEFHAHQRLYHEILNEPEWPDIARSMADWMNARRE